MIKLANTKIRVEYGRTVQTAPFESMKIHLAIEKDIEPNETVKDAMDKTLVNMAKYVKQQIVKQMEDL